MGLHFSQCRADGAAGFVAGGRGLPQCVRGQHAPKADQNGKEEYKKSVLEYEDVQEAVRYARELGIEQGREQGLEQGREEGRKQGILQGEINAKRLLARNMLAEGLEPATVAKISGLTEEELQELTRE